MGRILVIDDDDDHRDTVREILEDVGYAVVEAADGQEGLHRCRAAPVDLVITDIVMPRQEGLETIMELRREFPAVPIIAMSGGGQRVKLDCLTLAKRLGAARTFRKPLDPPELLTAVRELVPPGGAEPR